MVRFDIVFGFVFLVWIRNRSGFGFALGFGFAFGSTSVSVAGSVFGFGFRFRFSAEPRERLGDAFGGAVRHVLRQAVHVRTVDAVDVRGQHDPTVQVPRWSGQYYGEGEGEGEGEVGGEGEGEGEGGGTHYRAWRRG